MEHTRSFSQHTVNSRMLGAEGEAIAARYLEQREFQILAQNWRSQHGELDLIAHNRGVLVAIEVKTRRGIAYGHPLEAVTPQKLSRVRTLLGEWAQKNGALGVRKRIDVVGILLEPGKPVQIDHLRGVQ